ncbi:MAG: hypothetical protein ACR2OA_01495 [Rubripirellula sp.]|jgi:hypothetical protein
MTTLSLRRQPSNVNLAIQIPGDFFTLCLIARRLGRSWGIEFTGMPRVFWIPAFPIEFGVAPAACLPRLHQHHDMMAK